MYDIIRSMARQNQLRYRAKNIHMSTCFLQHTVCNARTFGRRLCMRLTPFTFRWTAVCKRQLCRALSLSAVSAHVCHLHKTCMGARKSSVLALACRHEGNSERARPRPQRQPECAQSFCGGNKSPSTTDCTHSRDAATSHPSN